MACAAAIMRYLLAVLFASILSGMELRGDEPPAIPRPEVKVVKPILQLPRGEETSARRTVLSVAIADDGTFAAATGLDSGLRIWDLQKAGTPPARLRHQWAGGTQSLSFAPGGKKLALINVGKHLTIWNKETEKLSQIDTGAWRVMHCVSFTSNGGLLATADGLFIGDDDRQLSWRVSVWDMPSGGLKHTFGNQRNRIEDIAISPDGSHLAIASEDGALRIWSITRGVKVLETERHEFAMYSVAFAPDGKAVAASIGDGMIRIWTVPQGVEVKGDAVARLSGHCVLFVDNSTVLVSGGKNGVMSIWDLRQNREICRLAGHSKYVSSVSFSRQKKWLVSGDWNGTVLVWDIGDAIKPDK